MPIVKEGLEGVVANETAISVIDGLKGILKYRGYNINDLAKHSNFEEVAFMLWFGKFPTKLQLGLFQKKLRAERKIDPSCIPILRKGSKNMSSMDALRTLTSYLGQFDNDLNKSDTKAIVRKAIRLTAKFPTIVAYYWRIRQGKKPIPPKQNLSHGENFLYMLTGKIPSKVQARAMELDFLLTAEHGMNASTFTTRVATSTLTDLHSAIVSGICTLKGPLHGAAREKVFDMLDEIKYPNNVEPYVLNKIKKNERIMGFGHRVYKTTDPRAKIFRQVSKLLADEIENQKWYDISTEMEKIVTRELVEKKGKPIYPNVDFYTGAVYKYLGIPKELSTGIFAIGRIAGWTAHILEQLSDNRLIRPRSKYTGPLNKKYIPIGERKNDHSRKSSTIRT
jgi:citrate synthase